MSVKIVKSKPLCLICYEEYVEVKGAMCSACKKRNEKLEMWRYRIVEKLFEIPDRIWDGVLIAIGFWLFHVVTKL